MPTFPFLANQRTEWRRDQRYQGFTYLGADNGIATPAPEVTAGSRPSPTGPATATAFEFLTAAAAAAGTAPPEAVAPTPANEPQRLDGFDGLPPVPAPSTGALPPVPAAATTVATVEAAAAGSPAVRDGSVVSDLEGLDEIAADEDGTPAAAAQALARIACRLYELADSLGGG